MSVERREQMDAACADRPKISDHRPNQVETWKHRTRNQLMFLPDLAASNDTCRIEQAPEAAAPLLLEESRSTAKTRSQRSLIKQRPESESGATANVGGKGRETASSAQEGGTTARLPGRSTANAEEEDVLQAGDFEDDSEGPQSSGQNTSTSEAAGAVAPVARAPAAPRTPIVVKTNPKVIQAEATRFPVPKAISRPAGAWASPIESPSSSRESVKELLAGRANGDAQEYAEVPMTPSRVPVRMRCTTVAINWAHLHNSAGAAKPYSGKALSRTFVCLVLLECLGLS